MRYVKLTESRLVSPFTVTVTPLVTLLTFPVFKGGFTKTALHVVASLQLTSLNTELLRLNSVCPDVMLNPVPVIVSTTLVALNPSFCGIVFGVMPVIVGKNLERELVHRCRAHSATDRGRKLDGANRMLGADHLAVRQTTPIYGGSCVAELHGHSGSQACTIDDNGLATAGGADSRIEACDGRDKSEASELSGATRRDKFNQQIIPTNVRRRLDTQLGVRLDLQIRARNTAKGHFLNANKAGSDDRHKRASGCGP
jgi:hypothetical protein